MKIIYSKRFEGKYPANPVESPDRVRLPASELWDYEFIEPSAALLDDITSVHSKEHVDRVKAKGLFDPASLAAGGAITAAELAMNGEAAFALIRPPGHHAAYNRSWGMCCFNNMVIAVKRIRPRAKRALIIDIDLHFGDGTVSIFRGDLNVKIVNPGSIDLDCDYLSLDSSGYMQQIEDSFRGFDFDVVGVSAGFDTYLEDWGGMLSISDYREIGRMIREGSERSKRCSGRRFAILEGGYHPDLKYCVKSFVKGFG